MEIGFDGIYKLYQDYYRTATTRPIARRNGQVEMVHPNAECGSDPYGPVKPPLACKLRSALTGPVGSGRRAAQPMYGFGCQYWLTSV